MKMSIKSVCAMLTALVTVFTTGVNTFGYGNLLYEKKNVQTIARGLTYEKSTRMYPEGWLDVYILTLDASESDLAMEVIESVDAIGAKANVEKLARDNGVIAAVNGDFFGSGTKKSSMGQVAKNGAMKAVQNYYNGSENRYAGFFIDNENVPFIDYVKSSMGFYSSDVSIEMGAKNKVTDFAKPVYFDKTAISSTATIDQTFSGLYKIKVLDNKIIDISGAGETVSLEDCDFIIVMNSSTAKQKLSGYSIGMAVDYDESEKFQFRPSKEISSIKFGVSGGGEMLRNGEIVSEGLIIGESARNPRTMLGVNQDKSKIYIVCIDGRKNGLGATHKESAYIMKEIGAWDAIHLDGGGSTTMVVQQEDSTDLSVVNIPSEGSLRAVANGVAIRATGEAGVPQRVKAYIGDNDDNFLFRGIENAVYVNVYDGQLNAMDVNLGRLKFSSSLDGEWRENKFIPREEGKGTITVEYEGVSDTINVNVLKGAEAIRVTSDSYSLDIGEKANLKALLVNKDGYTLDSAGTDIKWTVDNEDIGTVKGNVFTAKSEGMATITGTASEFGVSSQLTIAVGKNHIAIQSFESGRNMAMYYYPDDGSISGSSKITEGVAEDGKCSLEINYNFEPNLTTTQVVYAGLENRPLTLPAGSSDILCWYKGDGSDNILRAVLVDKNGSQQNVEFASDLNSTDWKQGRASIPSELQEPIVVDKIYVAALNTTDENTSGTVYVDNMSVLAPEESGKGDFTDVTDYMNTDLSSKTGEVISVFGRTSGGNSSNVVTQMAEGARAMAFAGSTNINNQTGVPAVVWNNKYDTNGTDFFSFVTLATGNGSPKAANGDQYRYLKDYCDNLSSKNVIVLMDRYLWTGINDSRERDAIHDILSTAVKEYGKNIIVVSSVGESNYVELKDGVRYVNLAGVGSNNMQYLRLKGNSNEMFYEFVDVS